MMGASFDSVKIAYILSCRMKKQLTAFAEYTEKSWLASINEFNLGVGEFFVKEEILQIFENYLFC